MPNAVEDVKRSLTPPIGIRAQRVAVLGGPAAMIMFLIGFIMAGFLVPPSPTRSAEDTTRFLLENATMIRWGLLLVCLSGGVYVLFSIVVGLQIFRIDQGLSVLALFRIAMAVLTGFIVIFPCYFWLYAVFRPRSPEIVQLLNDMGWITFGGFIWTLFWEYIVTGVAVFLDKRERPIFPRWYGYLSLAAAIGVLPAGLNVFFLEGPLAFNGYVAWWLEVTVVVLYTYLTFFLLLSIVKRQEIEERVLAPDLVGYTPSSDLGRRIASLEARLDMLPTPSISSKGGNANGG